MTRFAPGMAYQSHLDIRFTNGQWPRWAAPLVEGRPPNDRCWLVIMPRRGGKTWLASALVEARPAGKTKRVDLRISAAQVKKAGLHCLLDGKATPRPQAEVLVVDEPAIAPAGGSGINPAKLATGLGLMNDSDTVPIVLATPHEHSLLMKHLGPDAPKDVLLPPALNDREIARMVEREPTWAPDLITQVRQADPSWLRTPFLLELLLHVAEEYTDLRANIPRLLRAAVDEAERQHDYLSQVLHNGLTAEQRAELRANRWHAAGIETSSASKPTLLAGTSVPHDPVVAYHLPEILRIHHISDLHHGGNLRPTVDAKDRTRAGRRIAALVGAGTPLDSYLNHVSQLAAKGQAPHLIIVTGDIVNRPNPQFGEQAIAWLKKLRTRLAAHRDLRSDDPRIVLVGGNHDVSWEKCLDPEQQARHSWFAEIFRDYPHPDLHLPAVSKRRLFLKYPDVGLRLALLGSAESGGEAARDEDRDLLETFQSQFIAADDEDEVRDLIHKFERLDPGVVSRKILDRLGSETGYVTLAALHHPLSPVPSVEVAPYTGIVNAGQAKHALATARVALVLHGHTHLSFLAAERLLGHVPGWTLRVAGAATLASAASDEQNGYNEIFIAREGAEHIILVRPVRFDGGQWVSQREVAFRPGAAGEMLTTDLVSDLHPQDTERNV